MQYTFFGLFVEILIGHSHLMIDGTRLQVERCADAELSKLQSRPRQPQRFSSVRDFRIHLRVTIPPPRFRECYSYFSLDQQRRLFWSAILPLVLSRCRVRPTPSRTCTGQLNRCAMRPDSTRNSSAFPSSFRRNTSASAKTPRCSNSPNPFPAQPLSAWAS